MGAAGPGALPQADGLGLHRGERARVLPLPPVSPAPRSARWNGRGGRVREGPAGEGHRHTRNGCAVDGPRLRGAHDPARQPGAVDSLEETHAMSFHPAHDLGTWVGAALTLFVFSFL